jgi:hypothetical protein
MTKTWRIKNGKVVHDMDCDINSAGICTCGLLHYLLVHEDRRRLYEGEFDREYDKHYDLLAGMITRMLGED